MITDQMNNAAQPEVKPSVEPQNPPKSVKPRFATWTTLLLAVGIFALSALLGTLVASIIMKLRGGSVLSMTPDVTLIYYLIQMVPVIVFLVARRVKMGYNSGIHLTARPGTLPMLLWGIVCLLAVSVVIEPLLSLFPTTAYDMVQQSLGTGVWAILSTVVCAPILEEILFRGLILESVRERLGVAWAIVLSALLFGLVHGNLMQGINAFVIGLILGYVYVKTRSLTATIIIHAFNNAIGYVVMAYFGDAGELTFRELISNNTLYWTIYAVCAAIFLYAMVNLVVSLRNDQLSE